MAKLSRRASSSAATPSRGTTATTASTAAASVSPSHATGDALQEPEQQTRPTQPEQHQQKKQANPTNQSPEQHHPQQPRVARRAASSSGSNKPQAAALVDTGPEVLHENPSPSPAPAALSYHNSNSNTATPAATAAPAPPPAHATATPYIPLLPPGERNLTDAENAAERARVREEFFATYDVMTGVRIAATLGGFFGLMVFLIVWKSRSSSNETLKVLKDPKMAAVAAVCMQEEEEREIHDAIVATGMSIYPDEYDALVYRRQRMLSLGNVSAPPLLNRGYRCGSVGGVGPSVPVGYSYLLEPPRRFSYSAMSGGGGPGVGRRKSGSESSRIFSNYPMGGSFGTDDYFVETDDELEAEEYMPPSVQDEADPKHQRTDSTRSKQGFLSVPMAGHDSRRSSAMTCCSTDSSYLERRTSAYMGGCLSNLPPTLQRKMSTASRTSSIDNWDYYYPDIQVIQPTPKASPCPSERSVHDSSNGGGGGGGSGTASVSVCGSRSSNLSAPSFKRKHSIVSYDPDSAQAGRKQQIHSISADTVDVYPYNQESSVVDMALALPLPKPVQSAPPASAQQAFHFCDSPSEELRLGVRRKLTLVELQRNESNNNSFPYTANAAAPSGTTGTPPNSSSISVDSTPASLERLNGGSGGSLSMSITNKLPAIGNNNPEKRAPLASLSSFKISSLECPDSELRSLDEDSVFGVESPADTDDDMQQLSSDSEEQEAQAQAQALALAQAQTQTQGQIASVRVSCETKPNPALPLKRMSMSAVPSTGVGSGGGATLVGAGGARPRRPLLQRHRTIGATSSDRVALINQPLQLQQFHMGLPIQSEAAAPLETHFGAVVSQSPPRRGPLLQQYSDPQTTTTTTTTTTTEEDTCSTLNTELGLVEATGVPLGGGGGGGESATHTQYSSMNTVISLGRSTPSPVPLTSRMDNNAAAHPSQQQQQPAQLPTNATRLGHDPSPSSVSDSVIATRHQSICVPASLKDLILRKGSGPGSAVLVPASGISKSAANLSCESGTSASNTTTATPAVMLELPLIRLPNEEEGDDEDEDEDEAEAERDNLEREGAAMSGEKRDPSLPGTSRKWSKETLF